MPVEVSPATWPDQPEGLDDRRWAETVPVQLVDARTGEAPQWQTEVRLVAAAGTLWVRFACLAGTIRATMARYKDKVWQEDAVEVYVRPPGTEHLYEFQLSPIGTFRDLKVWHSGLPNHRYDETWSCSGALTEARIDRSPTRDIMGWRAMFGLPWRSLDDSSPGAEGWRIGLFRIERDPFEYCSLVSCPADELDLHDRRHLVPLVLDGVGRR